MYIFVTTLLEELCDLYNILFFQKLPWQTVRHSAFIKNKKDEPVKGPPLHPHWIPIVPKAIDAHIGCPCVMVYMHRNFWILKSKNHTDIVNHSNVLLLMLKSPLDPLNILNIYSDSAMHGGIQLLQNCASTLPEIGYMGGEAPCYYNQVRTESTVGEHKNSHSLPLQWRTTLGYWPGVPPCRAHQSYCSYRW